MQAYTSDYGREQIMDPGVGLLIYVLHQEMSCLVGTQQQERGENGFKYMTHIHSGFGILPSEYKPICYIAL